VKPPPTNAILPVASRTLEIPEALVPADVIGKLLSLTERSVYNHFHSGKIKGYRIGKSIRFRVSEVLACLEKS
jgi:hypothetical protein